jgi:hypothetical protein
VLPTITADPNGGALGKLFCKVAGTQTLTRTTARSLTAAAHRSGISTQGVSFGVPTRQTQALGPGPCSIVDLLLGLSSFGGRPAYIPQGFQCLECHVATGRLSGAGATP